MSIDIHTLLWLFPIAFIFHDFEEIIFWELWLKKNAEDIQKRLPAFLAKRTSTIFEKSTAEASVSIFLIFSFTVFSSFLAAEYQQYDLFLLTSGIFFIHSFLHVGQSVVLRRYVPAVITSVLVIIPYSLVLYGRLMSEGIIDPQGLLIYFLLAVPLLIPFILVMHKAGEYLYKKAIKLLVD